MRTAVGRQTIYREKHLVAIGTGTQTEWFTPWLFATGLDSILYVFKQQNADANFSGRLVYQTAAIRPDNPSAITTVGALQAGNTEYHPAAGSVSISASTHGALWVRFGMQYSGVLANITQADVGLTVSWNALGTFLGTRRIQLSANDTGSRIEVVTPWVPSVWLTQLKFATVITGLTGGSFLEWRPTYQTAPTSVQNPGAWSAAFGAWTTPPANTEANTGELAVTITDMWVRAGILYNLSAGAVQATATMDVMVCGRT